MRDGICININGPIENKQDFLGGGSDANGILTGLNIEIEEKKYETEEK